MPKGWGAVKRHVNRGGSHAHSNASPSLQSQTKHILSTRWLKKLTILDAIFLQVPNLFLQTLNYPKPMLSLVSFMKMALKIMILFLNYSYLKKVHEIYLCLRVCQCDRRIRNLKKNGIKNVNAFFEPPCISVNGTDLLSRSIFCGSNSTIFFSS